MLGEKQVTNIWGPTNHRTRKTICLHPWSDGNDPTEVPCAQISMCSSANTVDHQLSKPLYLSVARVRPQSGGGSLWSTCLRRATVKTS